MYIKEELFNIDNKIQECNNKDTYQQMSFDKIKIGLEDGRKNYE